MSEKPLVELKLSERMRRFSAHYDGAEQGWFADEVAALESRVAELERERMEYASQLNEFGKLGAVEKYRVMAVFPWHFEEAPEKEKTDAFVELHKYATALEAQLVALRETSGESLNNGKPYSAEVGR